jgi:hypothetical protein
VGVLSTLLQECVHQTFTNDYADARELGSDPIKQVNEHNLRPTSRIWDISDRAHPKLISVAHMPKSPKHPANPAHENIGIMEGAKTYPPAKGIFSGSMCGGGIFFLPDLTNIQPVPPPSGSRCSTTGWPSSASRTGTSTGPPVRTTSRAAAPAGPGTR